MDNRRKAALVASVIVVAAIIIALSLRSPPPPAPAGPGGGNVSDDNSTSVTGGKPIPSRQPVTLLAPPSSFPFVEKWVSQYNNEGHPGTVHVDYTDEVDYISSGAFSNSSDFLAHHLADMAITGKPAPPGSFAGPLVPMSPQAIAVVYNIPGFPDVPSGLKLDRPTLERLLSGNITRWDDPAIKSLNPGLSLPDKAVVVVHEGRARSATGLLEQYLSKSTAWPEKSMSAESADGLSTVVRQTPYSVGYVEFTYAVQTRMTFAALQNADGQYVAPSQESIGAAVRNGTGVQNSTALISTSQLGNGSYPIVGLYYATLGGAEKKPAALDFARWIAGEGQQVLKDMQYPSIYESSTTLRSYAASLRAEGVQPTFNSTNITKSEGESVYAQVAAQGASVYVAWEESMDDPASNDDIFFKRSTDGGRMFANAVNMSNNLGFSEHPQLAVSGENVYVAWTDDSSEVKQTMLAKSTDGGRSFGRPVPLSSPKSDASNLEMAAAGTGVYLVWQEHGTGGSNSVVGRASGDSGATFGPAVTIATGATAESFPKVAASGDAVHVAWNVAGTGVYYSKSEDGGTTFSQPALISAGRPAGEAQIAAYGNDVHVVWAGLPDSGAGMAYHALSADGGKTFDPPSPIEALLADPQNVELAIMPGQKSYSVYVASQSEVSAGNSDMLVAASADSGRTFGAFAADASATSGASECPSIAVSGNNIYVSWEDLTPGNHDIFLARGRA